MGLLAGVSGRLCERDEGGGLAVKEGRQRSHETGMEGSDLLKNTPDADVSTIRWLEVVVDYEVEKVEIERVLGAWDPGGHLRVLPVGEESA